jgi:hypothetical protein
MGTVLAMKRFMPLRSGVSACLIAVLAACSDSGPTPLVETFRTLGAQLGNRDAPVRDARAVLTPQIVAAAQQPYLLVELPSRQVSATRSIFQQRGPIQDWRGEDGISLILHNDILVGTRGLGPDLFSADPVPDGALRATRSGAYSRIYRHLDAENREVKTQYRCNLSPEGIDQVDLIAKQVSAHRIVETCQGVDAANSTIVNAYWIGVSDNLVWKSTQWISHAAQYATLYHLVR